MYASARHTAGLGGPCRVSRFSSRSFRHRSDRSSDDEFRFAGDPTAVVFSPTDVVRPVHDVVDDGSGVPCDVSDGRAAPLEVRIRVGAGQRNSIGRGDPDAREVLHRCEKQRDVVDDQGGGRSVPEQRVENAVEFLGRVAPIRKVVGAGLDTAGFELIEERPAREGPARVSCAPRAPAITMRW